MTPDKALRLEELNRNRAKWVGRGIIDYEMILEQSCFCLFGPYYGPNRVVVRGGEILRVVYLGETRDGFRRGDRLTRKPALKKTLDEAFADLEFTIRNLTPNAVLRVEYHEEYGFPTLIDFDRSDMEDEQSRLIVSDFRPK